MSNLFHLAQDAAKALTAYEKGLAKKKAGHTDVINAIIEYGKALLQGREAHEFGQKIWQMDRRQRARSDLALLIKGGRGQPLQLIAKLSGLFRTVRFLSALTRVRMTS